MCEFGCFHKIHDSNWAHRLVRISSISYFVHFTLIVSTIDYIIIIISNTWHFVEFLFVYMQIKKIRVSCEKSKCIIDHFFISACAFFYFSIRKWIQFFSGHRSKCTAAKPNREQSRLKHWPFLTWSPWSVRYRKIKMPVNSDFWVRVRAAFTNVNLNWKYKNRAHWHGVSEKGMWKR